MIFQCMPLNKMLHENASQEDTKDMIHIPGNMSNGRVPRIGTVLGLILAHRSTAVGIIQDLQLQRCKRSEQDFAKVDQLILPKWVVAGLIRGQRFDFLPFVC